MKKKFALLVAMLMLTASCDQSHLQQAQVPVSPGISESDRALLAWAEGSEKAGAKAPVSTPMAQLALTEDEELDGRKRLVPAIYAAFARRTTPARAKWLAEICYEQTEGTIFTPLDFALALFHSSSRPAPPKPATADLPGRYPVLPEPAPAAGETDRMPCPK